MINPLCGQGQIDLYYNSLAMKQINCLFFFFFLFSLTAFSQKNGSVKGVTYDELAKKPVPGATITLLAKKDSLLVSFTMSDNLGRFELTGIPVGEYRLLITHVNYRNSNIRVHKELH